MILFWGALLALAIAAAWGLGQLRRVATVGSAYKAKVLASHIFGAGRAIDPRWADEVSAETYRVLRLFRSRVDHEKRVVTVSLPGFRPRTAIYRDGLGATLTRAADLGASPTDVAPGSRGPSSEWPEGEGSAQLRHVVEAAFEEPDRRRLRRTRAIVVVRNGRIVAERYAQGFAASTPFPGWSMTKSVVGALVGILVGEGRLSLEARDLLPQWRAPDPRAEIRLEDLLRMRSGLQFSEVYTDLSSDVNQMLFNTADAAAYAARLPLSAPPGTIWSYSSGTTNILSGIVRRVVGEKDYLSWPRRMLFDPIGMNSAVIEPDASGTFVCSSFMLATARDWARFGQLYLQDGVWESRRVLPEGWVGFSTSPTPQSPDDIYGAHWWRGLKPELGGATAAAACIPPDAFFAVGHEGQTISVVPSRGLVVVRLGLSIHIDAWNHAAFLADLLDTVQPASAEVAHGQPRVEHR